VTELGAALGSIGGLTSHLDIRSHSGLAITH
jgi:hypothetical protein